MADDTSLSKTAAEETTPAELTRSGRFYRPNCDIIETTEELLVRADIPGAKSEEIDINFEEGMLSIHAPVAPRQPDRDDYLICEYGVGDYYRTFQVSEAIDASKITADYAHGVLTLHLPKAEAAKPRRIEVHAAG
jgi:HSP20 family molecular chaperone IbpA